MSVPDVSTSIAATTIGLPRARRPADVPPSIPDYRFIKVIGRGAFGTVWLAEEPLAGVFRAIKVLDGGGRSRKVRANLTNRELEGLHAFQTRAQGHTHLIQVYKTGLCTISPSPSQGEGQGEGPSLQASDLQPQGLVYYVMEIADHAGGAQPFRPADYRPLTLAEVLRRKGRLPVDQVLADANWLLAAIEHLHTAGIQHRDVKPPNILFVDGVLKLADVGLVGEPGDESIGTSGYLPPDGKPDDLYAFGKVLYEMTTSLPASAFPEWPGDLGESPPLDKGRFRVGLLEVQPDSAVEARTLSRLRDLINRLCHPDRARRLVRIDEIRLQLASCVEDQSITVSRRKALLGMAATAIAALSVAAWGMKWWSDQENSLNERSARPPYDGSGREQECTIDGQTYRLTRYHEPAREYVLLKHPESDHASVFDLQTAFVSNKLIVTGRFRIFNRFNAVTCDVSKPRGQIDQLLLVAEENVAVLYHGQPGAEPGVSGRFLQTIDLETIKTAPGPNVPIRIVFMQAATPEQAVASWRKLPNDHATQSVIIAGLMKVPAKLNQ